MIIDCTKKNLVIEMYPKYSDYLKNEGEDGNSANYLDIWNINPFHSEISIRNIVGKILFLAVIIGLGSIFVLVLFSKVNYLVMTVSLPMMLLFSENIYKVYYNIGMNGGKVKELNPFKNLLFWMNDSETLLIVNKKCSLVLAVRIFKLTILPEFVHPTLNHFFKALYNAHIKFSYQVIQTPLIDQKKRIENTRNIKTTIYFSVFEAFEGFITKNRINSLVKAVENDSKIFKSRLSSNFHHTQLILLAGVNLINAVRAIFCGFNSDSTDIKEERQSKINIHFVIKSIIIISFLSVFTFFLILLSAPWFIIVAIDTFVVIGFIMVWWRDLLYSISRSCFLKNIDVKTVDPFRDITYYRLKHCDDSLFILLDNHLLVGLKISNLLQVTQKCYIFPDKFFRELNNHNINFAYTLQSVPVLPQYLGKRFRKALNEKGTSDLEHIFGRTTLDGSDNIPSAKDASDVFKNWLSMRTGIWDAVLTVSVLSYTYLNQSDFEHFYELEDQLDSEFNVMVRACEDNFLQFSLGQLYRKSLLDGYRLMALKTSFFNESTQLSCVYFQGKNLINLASISNEFKKGIETRIPAEFNTPFNLKNDIIIGETINTEVLEREAEFGFTLPQLKHLLITNGLSEQREHTMMKLVMELTKRKIPCIIFDYSGNWTKMMNFFTQTIFEQAFLYFKLGRTLSVDLIKSDIRLDERNIEYLNLFFDVFALAFKEQKKTVDVLKDTISKKEILSLEDVALDKEMEIELTNYNEYNTLLTLLHGFIDWRAFFSSNSLKAPQETKTIDFIKNDKSIIIDLSLLEKMSQKNFIAFIVLSKFIHYLKRADPYYPKLIILPDVDLFFDGNYIDNYNTPVDFDRINRFVYTLLQKDFGFIFSANQIGYLHSQVFNYFPNIITFKATDIRDIAVLKNQMNLQDFQGTGYYSSKRNNTYQIEYLKELQENNVIVKRSDIPQPFPGVINYEEIMSVRPLSREGIITHMKKQGYDYIKQERKILAGIKKTLLEKDMGNFLGYINEILNFLNAITTVDKVGGLYEHRLKEELLKYIFPKASKQLQNKRKIKELRDFIFKTLITQDYLVESHPRQAVGGETIRTCYKVGEKYYTALNDYYNTRNETPPDIKFETIEKNTNGDSKADNNTIISILLSDNFKKIAFRELGNVIWHSFKVHQANEKKTYETSLKIGKEVILNYLESLYENFIKLIKDKTTQNIPPNSFVKALISQKIIPFTIPILRDYCLKSEDLCEHVQHPEKNAYELEELIMKFVKTTRAHFMQN